MSGARVEEVINGFRVTCEEHDLDRTVETGKHAANLQALHNRVDHADDTDSIEVDLTAAAAEIVEEWDRNGPGASFAADLWCALTGIQRQREAIAHARAIAASEQPLVAAVPPF